MANSNKLVYTSTYKEAPIHADLHLAREPWVPAHMPPQSPIHADLQLAKKLRVAAHTPAGVRIAHSWRLVTACTSACSVIASTLMDIR